MALAEAIAERFATLIYMAAYLLRTAMGELAALQCERLELARGVIHVVEALSEVDGHLHLKSTKTGGTRTVSLPLFLVAMLGEHLSRHPSRVLGTCPPRPRACRCGVGTSIGGTSSRR